MSVFFRLFFQVNNLNGNNVCLFFFDRPRLHPSIRFKKQSFPGASVSEYPVPKTRRSADSKLWLNFQKIASFLTNIITANIIRKMISVIRNQRVFIFCQTRLRVHPPIQKFQYVNAVKFNSKKVSFSFIISITRTN